MSATPFDPNCCEEFFRLVSKAEDLSSKLWVAEENYFVEMEKSLDILQNATTMILAEVYQNKGKWDYDGVKTATGLVAELTNIVVGAGLGEARKLAGESTGVLGKVFEGEQQAIQTGVFKIIEAKDLPESQVDYLHKVKHQMVERAKEVARWGDEMEDALTGLENIAKKLQECFHCEINLKEIPSPKEGNVDPDHAVNAPLRQVREKLVRAEEAPCNLCRDIQGLWRYIQGHRYIIFQRRQVFQWLTSQAKEVNSNALELLNLVHRDLWSGTVEGGLGDIITSALAVATPWGAVAKAVTEKIFTYLEKRTVGGAAQTLREQIRKDQRAIQKYLYWVTRDGPWSNMAKGLDWELHRLLRYKYGKCSHPCDEKEEPSREVERGSAWPEKEGSPSGPAVRLFGGEWGESLRRRFSPQVWAGILLGILLLCGALIWIGIRLTGEGSGGEEVVVGQPGGAQGDQPAAISLGLTCTSLLPSPDELLGVLLRCYLAGIGEGTFSVVVGGNTIIQGQRFQDGRLTFDLIDLLKEGPPVFPMGFTIRVFGRGDQKVAADCQLHVTTAQHQAQDQVLWRVGCQTPDGKTSQAEGSRFFDPVEVSCGGDRPGVYPGDSLPCNTNLPWGFVTVRTDGTPLGPVLPITAQDGVVNLGPFDPDTLPPGSYRLQVEVQDPWGRKGLDNPIIVVLPGGRDPFEDPVVCGSGEPSSDPLPPYTDITSVVILLFPPGSEFPSRVYVHLRAPVPAGGYFFGGIAPSDDPFNPVVGISADRRRVDTYNALRGYWLTNTWLVVFLTPDFASEWAANPDGFGVFSESDQGNGLCDLARLFQTPPFDPDRMPDPMDNIPFWDPLGDPFDRDTGEPVERPEVDIVRIIIQRTPEGQLMVKVYTAAPVPREWWSRAVEVQVGTPSSSQSCLWQIHNGEQTRQGEVDHQGTMTTCTFQWPQFPIVVEVNTYGQETRGGGQWTGDTFRIIWWDGLDWRVSRFLEHPQGP